MHRANGSFEVKMMPMAAEAGVGDPSVCRMNLHKTFHGELNAVGSGQMLALRTATEGSAGYVALERVSGTLHGKVGSFALQHRGVMTRGAPELLVTIVPDSGTDELMGISGQLEIEIKDGKHFYALEYDLPESR